MKVKGLLDSESDAKAIQMRVSADVIGARVRRERIAHNISIRELATKANLSPHSITRLEAGHPFRAITLVKVCAALEIHLDRIAAATDDDIAAKHSLSDHRWHYLDGYAEGFFGGRDGILDARQRKDLASSSDQNPLVILKSRLDAGVLLSTIIEVHVPSETRAHPGEELVYAINGPVGVTVAGRPYRLETGESLVFWGTEPHNYFPVEKTVGVLLSVRARS